MKSKFSGTDRGSIVHTMRVEIKLYRPISFSLSKSKQSGHGFYFAPALNNMKENLIEGM